MGKSAASPWKGEYKWRFSACVAATSRSSGSTARSISAFGGIACFSRLTQCRPSTLGLRPATPGRRRRSLRSGSHSEPMLTAPIDEATPTPGDQDLSGLGPAPNSTDGAPVPQMEDAASPFGDLAAFWHPPYFAPSHHRLARRSGVRAGRFGPAGRSRSESRSDHLVRPGDHGVPGRTTRQRRAPVGHCPARRTWPATPTRQALATRSPAPISTRSWRRWDRAADHATRNPAPETSAPPSFLRAAATSRTCRTAWIWDSPSRRSRCRRRPT